MLWIRTLLVLLFGVWVPTGIALVGLSSTLETEADRSGAARAAATARAVETAFLERALEGWDRLAELPLESALDELGQRRLGPASQAFFQGTGDTGRPAGFLIDASGRVAPEDLRLHVALLAEQLARELPSQGRWRGAWALSDDTSHTVAAVGVRSVPDQWQGAAALLQPIDDQFVRQVAARADAHLTLLRGFEVALSSLPSDRARPVIEPALGGRSSFSSGELETPLDGALPGFGPLALAALAPGHAYASQVIEVSGSDLRWVVSVSQRETLALAGTLEAWILLGSLIISLAFGLQAFLSPRASLPSSARVREAPIRRATPAVVSSASAPSAAAPPASERLASGSALSVEAPSQATSGAETAASTATRGEAVESLVTVEDVQIEQVEERGPEREEDFEDLDDLSLSRALPGEMTIAAMNSAVPVVEVSSLTEHVVEIEPYELSMSGSEGTPLDAFPVPAPDERQAIRTAYHAFVSQRESAGERTPIDFQRFAERLIRRRRLHEEKFGPSESVRYEVYERFGQAAMRLIFTPARRTG